MFPLVSNMHNNYCANSSPSEEFKCLFMLTTVSLYGHCVAFHLCMFVDLYSVHVFVEMVWLELSSSRRQLDVQRKWPSHISKWTRRKHRTFNSIQRRNGREKRDENYEFMIFCFRMFLFFCFDPHLIWKQLASIVCVNSRDYVAFFVCWLSRSEMFRSPPDMHCYYAVVNIVM